MTVRQTAAVTRRADTLLSGPRGRRLCLELAEASRESWSWPALTWRDGPAGYPVGRFEPDDLRASLAAELAATDLTGVGSADILTALVRSVDAAMYWQPPDDEDQLIADAELAALLRPVAELVAAAPASRWWSRPLDATGQHVVGWEPEHPAPRFTGARSALARWRDAVREDERQAVGERTADPRDQWAGAWWSTPAHDWYALTTGVLPGSLAPARLSLVEDTLGWQTAVTWPVPVPEDARVLEVTRPADWVDLVRRHPLEVTVLRRGTWWQATGWDGTWVIPDWAAVAEEFDAVHLTVDGYLSTAGRALPVDVPGPPACTLLAGFEPDATWWLTDLPELGEPTRWERRDEEWPRWTPA